MIDSVIGDNIPILTEQEKFNETITSSVKRIGAALTGELLLQVIIAPLESVESNFDTVPPDCIGNLTKFLSVLEDLFLDMCISVLLMALHLQQVLSHELRSSPPL